MLGVIPSLGMTLDGDGPTIEYGRGNRGPGETSFLICYIRVTISLLDMFLSNGGKFVFMPGLLFASSSINMSFSRTRLKLF